MVLTRMIGVAATQGCPLEAADYSHGGRAVNGIRVPAPPAGPRFGHRPGP